MLRVIALSDTHGKLISIHDGFDLMLICGDILPDISDDGQLNWFKDCFTEWVNELPFADEFSRVVLIGGNHDFAFENKSRKEIDQIVSMCNGRLVYLDNELYTFNSYEGIKYQIFGCPYCKPLTGWAFCYDNLQDYYDGIPYGVDFLLTHDAPDYKSAGYSTEGRCAGRNFGNELLRWYIHYAEPKYHFFGHIHSSPVKELTDFDNDYTKFCNVSVLNEEYLISYDYKFFMIE